MPTLSSYPVLIVPPDFASPPRLRATRLFDQVKLSTAPETRLFRGAHAQHTLYFDFLLHGREAIRELSDFFFSQRGKWGEFFLLSWHAELKPAASILNGQTALSIDPIGYAELFANDPVGNPVIENLGHHVFLLHDEGDLHLSAVNSVSGSDPEILQLATAVTRDFDLDRFFVGWIYFVRFMNDELEWEFNGPESALCSLAMTELIVTPVETTFDPNACSVADIVNGGGDTFDCYTVGSADDLPLAGTGFNGGWVMGNSLLGFAFGDEFDSYAVGAAGTMNAGTGFNGNWCYDSAAIDSVTISSVEDRRLVLNNSQAARVLNIGTNWTRLRLACRVAMDDTGANIGGTPRLYLGVMSAPTSNMSNGPLGSSCSHFFGTFTNGATFTRNTGPIRYAVGTTLALKKVGSVVTDSGSNGMENWHIGAVPSTTRQYVIIEIVKGSPNFTVAIAIATGTVGSVVDGDLTMLKRALELDDFDIGSQFPFLSLDCSAARSIAVDEATDGFFNAICVAWDESSSSMRFSELLWAKMA